MPKSPFVHYVKTNFDSIAIVTILGKITFQGDANELNDEDLAVLSALRRAVPELREASLDKIQGYLEVMSERQLIGLTSNVKGVLHEMEFVRVENEDGDSVYASYFEAINHPDTDIQLIDHDTGESWDVQLKATDNASYVQDWIDAHPDGDILVTEELADRLNLETTGESNEELTADVDQFVDKMIDEPVTSSLWGYFPALTAASIALVVWQLWRRYRLGEISMTQFKQLSARATGIKVAKIGVLAVLLSIPVVGQATGAVLIAKLLHSARDTWFELGKSIPAWRIVPQSPKLLPP